MCGAARLLPVLVLQISVRYLKLPFHMRWPMLLLKTWALIMPLSTMPTPTDEQRTLLPRLLPLFENSQRVLRWSSASSTNDLEKET